MSKNMTFTEWLKPKKEFTVKDHVEIMGETLDRMFINFGSEEDRVNLILDTLNMYKKIYDKRYGSKT